MKILLTSLLIISFSITPLCAQSADAKSEQARQAVAKIGTGQKAKVAVKMRDSSQLKGYIESANDDSFSLVDEKSGSVRNIKFADVERIDRRGGSNKFTFITLAVVAGVAAIIVGLVAKRCSNEGGC